MALTQVYTLADYTDHDSAKDPNCPPPCSRRSAKTSQQASCSDLPQEQEVPAQGVARAGTSASGAP